MNDPVISAPVYGPNSAPGGRSATGTTAGPNGTEPIKTTPPYALQGDPSAGINDEVVFHVRSNVASYWRSKVLGDFDGTYWLASGATNNLVKSESATGYWFDEEALDVQARYRYPQTFFPLIDEELPIFTGYQGLQVVTTGGDTDASLFAGGETYRVVSALPEHTPTRLRRDRSRSTYWGLTDLPEGSERLVALAERLSEGAISDFEKLERILAYVAEFTEFDPNLPAALTSSTSLNGFLFEEEPGSVLDHATATIMLARALQMPARLAVGYLPGTRDPLTGTYKVRQGDAHAWAEVHFRRNGWVPFDSAPRATLVVGDRAPSGVGRLFHAGLGEEVYGPLRDGPGQAFRTLAAGLPGPLFLILGLSLGLVVLVARWFQTKSRNPTSQRTQPFPRYSSLTGDGRKEIRRLYLEAEKLLRRRSGRKREAWQTVGGYTSSAGGQDPEVQKHLSWLTWALWHSAYRPGDLPFQLVSEARHRLSLFKSAFRAAKKRPPSEVGA